MPDLVYVTIGDDGRLAWPPTTAARHVSVARGRAIRLAAELYLLARQTYQARHGRCIGLLRDDLRATYGIEATITAIRSDLAALEGAQVIEVDRGPRRTYRIALRIDPSALPPEPPRIVHPQPSAVEPEPEPEPAPAPEPEPEPDRTIDYTTLAIALLDLVVARATSPTNGSSDDSANHIRAERDHLAQLVRKRQAELDKVTRDRDVMAGRIKALQCDLAEERRLRDQIDRNLQAVLDTINKLVPAVDEQTRAALDRLMRAVPGYAR